MRQSPAAGVYALSDEFTTSAFSAKADSYYVVIETVACNAKGTKPLATVKSKAFKPKVILKPKVLITSPKSGDKTPAATKSASLSVAVGKTQKLSIKASGTAKLAYEWCGPDGNVITDTKGKAINKASLTLKPASKTDTIPIGTYTLTVTNPASANPAYIAVATIHVSASSPRSSASATISAASVPSGFVTTSSTSTNTSLHDLSMAIQTAIDSNDTLRLTESITGNSTLLTLNDPSLQNLHYEVVSANAARLSFDRIDQNDGDGVWETVTFDLSFDSVSSGDYQQTTLRTRVTFDGDLVDESQNAIGLFEIE